MEEAQSKPERPNSARPAAVQPLISPGRPSRGATPQCLGFGEGPARVGPLPPSLRGSLETEVALLKPGRPNSACQAAVQPRISLGRPSRGATPPCLRFGKGLAHAGPLPPHLRGSFKTEEAQIKPERPNSACPAAIQPRISLGWPSRGATPPCLGFGEGPARAGPFPPSLRGSLQTEVALLKPELPNSARPVTVQPELARAASHAMRHLRALDSVKVTCAGAPSLPASGAVSSRKWPYLCLGYLTQPAQRPSSP